MAANSESFCGERLKRLVAFGRSRGQLLQRRFSV